MIKAIIVDDEENACISLSDDLKKYCPGIQLVGVACTIKSARLLIKTTSPELIFLDINLGEESGFGLLEQLAEENSRSAVLPYKIIFTTAHDQYAIRAIKFSALDYLLKPIDPTELVAATGKAGLTSAGSVSARMSIDVLLENTAKQPLSSKKVVLAANDGLHVYHIDNIIRCEAQRNYTSFHFSNEKPLLVSKTLKEFEELLKEYKFERIHHTHLINLNYLKKFVKTDGGYVVMADGSNLPVAQRKKEQLLQLLSSL